MQNGKDRGKSKAAVTPLNEYLASFGMCLKNLTHFKFKTCQ